MNPENYATSCDECRASIHEDQTKEITVTESRPRGRESIPVDTYECPECGYCPHKE